MDLLGGLIPEPAQPKPAAPQGFGGPAGAPLDLLAGSPSPPPGGGGGGPLDLLGGVGGNGGDVGGAVYGLATAGPAVQAQLANLPKSHPMDVMVASDPRVQVSYIKAYGPESTTIAVFVSNKTPQPITNVTLPLSIPPGLSGNFTGEPTPTARPGAAPGTHNVLYPVLGPSQTVSLLMNLSVRELTFLQVPSLAVGGQLQVAGGGAPLTFSIPLELSDLCRPAQMTTPQYGGFWKQYTDEAKGAVRPSSVTQPAEYMGRVQAVRLFPVQTIGAECIAAGKLVSPAAQVGAANLLVFIHGKVATGGVDLTVRSKSQPLSQALIKSLQTALR